MPAGFRGTAGYDRGFDEGGVHARPVIGLLAAH